MVRAAEWSRATALANPSVMRVGSMQVMFLPIFVVVGFTIIISWLQAPRFGDWNEDTQCYVHNSKVSV